MFDAVFVIIILWGLVFGFVLARNYHRIYEIFFTDHENMNIMRFSDSVITSCMFIPFMFLAPYQGEPVSFDPISAFVWERLIISCLAVGIGFALSRWAKSQELI